MDIQSVSLQKLIRQTPMEPITPKFQYWDPASDIKYNEISFYGARAELERKYNKYKNNPEGLRNNLILLSLLIIGEIILLILLPDLLKILLKGGNIYVIIMPVLPIIYYIYRINSLQTDLIKMIIAKEHNWLYNPIKNPMHWSSLYIKYPETFEKGNMGQNMQDEFWGKFKSVKQTVNFYSAIFEYQIQYDNGENNYGNRSKYTRTFQKTTFILQLNKKIKANFRLKPEGISTKFLNFFEKKEIDTESSEFNRTFSVFYAGQKVENELEIVKMLSPAVQMKLLDLKEKKGTFTILFHEDVVIFLFENNLYNNFKTNFFKKVELAPEDKEMIQQTLNTILEISSKIIQYLD